MWRGMVCIAAGAARTHFLGFLGFQNFQGPVAICFPNVLSQINFDFNQLVQLHAKNLEAAPNLGTLL